MPTFVKRTRTLFAESMQHYVLYSITHKTREKASLLFIFDIYLHIFYASPYKLQFFFLPLCKSAFCTLGNASSGNSIVGFFLLYKGRHGISLRCSICFRGIEHTLRFIFSCKKMLMTHKTYIPHHNHIQHTTPYNMVHHIAFINCYN